MRILVCGGRNFGNLPLYEIPTEMPSGGWCIINKTHPDYEARNAEYQFGISTLYEICDKYNSYSSPDAYDNRLPEVVIIHGGAAGADKIADEWAMVNWCHIEEYKADWDKYGRSAGPIRNKRMLTEGKPDLVVAFPGGRGTMNMIKLAKEAGVEVLEVKYDV